MKRTLPLVLAVILTLEVVSIGFTPTSQGASQLALPRLAKHTPEAFNQALRENALFFNMLVTLSFTAAIARPAWGLDVKDINVNLITRAVRDVRGRQLVRVRVAGVVRKNHNVELDILNENGTLVGKGFFGYESGQLTFYNGNSKAIISGFMDSRGYFLLDDLRLPRGKQDLANGYIDPCFNCSYLAYGWWDGLNIQVGGGRIFPYFSSDDNRIRVVWSFERGRLGDNQSASGEAEYDLAGETTGAINSVLFDTGRTADSFFANPYSLVPEPLGKSLIPRFTDGTGIAVTNPESRDAGITFIARRYDGSVIAGEGILNPVTYTFSAGQQFAAFPADIFRGLNEKDRRPILPATEVGWIEIFSDDTDVQAMYLDGNDAGTALDGNIGGENGSNVLIFPDLRLSAGESTEISLLNLAYDDVMVRLELLNRDGRVLREEREHFIAGYGVSNFFMDASSDFLRINDPALAASLRVTCNNDNSIKSSSCSRLIGVAHYRDSFESLASVMAASPESAGPVLIGAQFAAGRSGRGAWQTIVRIAKLTGSPAPVDLDLYDTKGNLLHTLQQPVIPGGQGSFSLRVDTLPSGEKFTSGYVRLRSASGEIAGDVSLTWSDGQGSMSSTYPLANFLSNTFQFNQVAQGRAGGIEYWTGAALMNDLERQVTVTLRVIRADGTLDRSVNLILQPYQQVSKLLSELVDEPAYTRLNGYIRISTSDPITAVVLYGDAGNRFLSAVPGIPR